MPPTGDRPTLDQVKETKNVQGLEIWLRMACEAGLVSWGIIKVGGFVYGIFDRLVLKKTPGPAAEALFQHAAGQDKGQEALEAAAVYAEREGKAEDARFFRDLKEHTKKKSD